MSIRMQRDINELKTRIEKLESVAVSLIARLDALELEQEQSKHGYPIDPQALAKRKPGRPKKNGHQVVSG